MSWALVIFASREAPLALRRTIDAALIAARGLARIDVLVNGNAQLAADISRYFTEANGALIPPVQSAAVKAPAMRIWTIPLGDKANAWNQYIHQIWAGEELAFFVDGYVRLNPDAVQLLGSAVKSDELALGGSGVPTMGRSADALRQNLIVNTGFHGNFCCIKGHAMAQMRDARISLPVGLYRTDALMGAFLCYAMNPATHVWEDHRIWVHPTASWDVDLARWWRLRDLIGIFKRVVRQARGRLENKAIANHLAIRRQLPQQLPKTAKELVLEWARRCPADLQPIISRDPLARWALRDICTKPVAVHAGQAAILLLATRTN